jgi:DNA-binding GntR family transcriptional regulator
MVSEVNIRTQLRLLETRREIERLLARSAALRAKEEERARFRAIADGMEAAARSNDDKAFLRLDQTFNLLVLDAAQNEFAAGAMMLMNGLSRRFWYIHYKEAADMPLAARLHAEIARAIAKGDRDKAGAAADRLLDYIETFTRATLDAQG